MQGESQGYLHYAHLADYQLTDYVIYNLFPNNVITVGPDGVQLLRPRPHPTDPAQCLFDHWWLVNRVAGQDTTPSPAGGPDLPVVDAMHEHIRYGEKTSGYDCRSGSQYCRNAAKGARLCRLPRVLDAQPRAPRSGFS